MSRDRLIEAFDAITSPDLRAAIVAAVVDAQFVESVIAGGSDSYTKPISGSSKGKPESKAPTGVEFAKHTRAILLGFESVSSAASRLEVRLDELRDLHDGVETQRQADRRRTRGALRLVRHLQAKAAGVVPVEDERG